MHGCCLVSALVTETWCSTLEDMICYERLRYERFCYDRQRCNMVGYDILGNYFELQITPS